MKGRVVAQVRSGRRHFWRLKLLGALVLGATVAWIAGALGQGFRLQTAPARFGAVEARFEGRAVIARDEQVVPAPSPGKVTLLAGEGRHVRTGEPVLELIADEGATRRELSALERRIAAVDADHRERTAALERERREVEGRLEEARRKLRDGLAAGSPAAASEAEARLREYERRLAQIAVELRQADEEKERLVRELEQARESLMGAHPAESVVLRAPVSGYLSFGLDGLEGLLFPGAPLEAFMASSAARTHRVQDGFAAAAGAPLFRVVSSDRAEVAIEVRGPAPLPAGTPVRIAFASVPERQFRGSVVQVLTVNQTSWVRVALREFDASLVHLRFDRATIAAQEVRGVIVPASSVVEVDGRLGVYLLVGDSLHFRRVKLLGGDEKNAVIEGIDGVPLGARVVVRPEAAIRRQRGQEVR